MARVCLYWNLAGQEHPGVPKAGRRCLAWSRTFCAHPVKENRQFYKVPLTNAVLIELIFKDLLILIVFTFFEYLQIKHTLLGLKIDASEGKAGLTA